MNAEFYVVATDNPGEWHLVRIYPDGRGQVVDSGELSWIEWLKGFCLAARVARGEHRGEMVH